MDLINNVNIESTVPLVAPNDLRAELPVEEPAASLVYESRESIKRILQGEEDRLIVVVGPCSIHDQSAALEYARRLHRVAQKVKDKMLVVMRVYFEKPRTVLGWKGLINDPHLNDTFDVRGGVLLARSILREIANIGLPAATEMLEPITPQYIADLISLASIGARTTESPTHRQMASGLSMPVGFKNGTDGSLDVAVNAMKAAQSPHRFLGIDDAGNTCIMVTKGNPWGHLILRGGRSGPNYDADSVAVASARLSDLDASPRFLVDCSHANSNKDHRRQSIVWNDVINQRLQGNRDIIGLMVESNIHEGNQKLTADLTQLQFGVSITDACIGWDETEELLLGAYEKMKTAG